MWEGRTVGFRSTCWTGDISVLGSPASPACAKGPERTIGNDCRKTRKLGRGRLFPCDVLRFCCLATVSVAFLVCFSCAEGTSHGG